MSKNTKAQGASGSDDISVLFERFGANADVKNYQPFDHPDLPHRARPAEPAAQEVPSPAPLHMLRPIEVDHSEQVVKEAADTPLAKLFQRLLQDAAEVRDVGPLQRLFLR